MNMSFIVAIDGPAGTGKGTVTERIAKKQNLVNIDTGRKYKPDSEKLKYKWKTEMETKYFS